MTTTTLSTPSHLGRIARATPVLGRVIRDVEREVDTVYYLLTIFVTAVVLAVQTWGLPALVLTAVALVPVMFVILIVLARP
jgi:cation transporter-like permease